MIATDRKGRLWHRGTKLGLIYSVITLIVFGVTMTQDPDGPLAWLSSFGPLVILIPLASATQAYAWGQRDQFESSRTQEEDRQQTRG